MKRVGWSYLKSWKTIHNFCFLCTNKHRTKKTPAFADAFFRIQEYFDYQPNVTPALNVVLLEPP